MREDPLTAIDQEDGSQPRRLEQLERCAVGASEHEASSLARQLRLDEDEQAERRRVRQARLAQVDDNERRPSLDQ